MTSERQRPPLKITFHNPNTPEETARYLSKVIAQSLAAQVIAHKLAQSETAEQKQ